MKYCNVSKNAAKKKKYIYITGTLNINYRQLHNVCVALLFYTAKKRSRRYEVRSKVFVLLIITVSISKAAVKIKKTRGEVFTGCVKR